MAKETKEGIGFYVIFISFSFKSSRDRYTEPGINSLHE